MKDKSFGRASFLTDKRCGSEKTSIVDSDIYIERISKYLKEEFVIKYKYRKDTI